MAAFFRSLSAFSAALALGLVAAFALAAPAPTPALPPGVVPVAVPEDAPAFALAAASDTAEVIVYLHGRCGDPFAGLRSFPGAIRAAATMVSVLGDIPCPDRPGRRRWSTSGAAIQRRIDAAVKAASRQLDRPLEPARLTLFGYSEGALRAELLVAAFPERYPRVLLGGEPRAPVASNFAKARAVVTLAGQYDAQQPMREGADSLKKAGVDARYWMLPRARHGQYGPEGERVMGEAFTWLFAPR